MSLNIIMYLNLILYLNIATYLNITKYLEIATHFLKNIKLKNQNRDKKRYKKI